jgi:V/A-type H+-transporting ATPase subunit I
VIVDLHKYLIVGSRSEMDRFFEVAQSVGFMEFIGISHKKTLEMPEKAKAILSAIKIARAHTAEDDPNYRPKEDPVQLAENILETHAQHEKLLEEKRILRNEIARIAPFGDFSRKDLDLLQEEAKRVFQFFVMKNDHAKLMQTPEEVIYLGTSYDLSYFVAINREKVQYPKMIEVIIDHPVGKLKEKFARVNQRISELERQIHNSAKDLPFLQQGLAQYLNEYDLAAAKRDASSPLGESIFAIEAWVPKNKIKALHTMMSNVDVLIEEISIEPNDRIPTCMENKGAARLGEDLVKVYDTPDPKDKDPSLWVLIFFSLFFAIIIGDAGYGMIYLSAALFFKYKLKNPSPVMRRFLKTSIIVSTACVIWGTLTTSFFGIQIGPENPMRQISFFHYLAVKKADYHIAQKDDVYEEYVHLYPEAAQAADGHEFFLKTAKTVDGHTQYEGMEDFYDSILLELSLFIGVIHIALSFLRYLDRNWTGFGWVLFLIGGYLYFPSFVEATSFVNYLGWISKEYSQVIGLNLLLTGLGLVLLLSLVQKRKIGAALHELTNSIQVFGDVLSYLRLYALALAGMMMALTFNDLGRQIGYAGVFVIIIGHGVNLTLAIMSGVIHGLRLNFLEWYHYCFDGGGKIFNPLRIRKVK